MEQPEPAFQMRPSGMPQACRDAARQLAFLEMYLARQPDDLTRHAERVRIACQLNDGEAIYGALVDLFIALSKRGVGLKSAMLSQTALQLEQAQRRFLASHLADGVRADENVQPPARRSVLTRGLAGTTTPAH